MRKRSLIRTVFGILLLLLLSAVSVLADSTSTELDPFTGQPASEQAEETETSAADSLIPVSGGVWYDPERHAFAHDISEVLPSMLYCSVPSGTVTTELVSISVPAGCGASLYRNGVLLDNPNYSGITRAGSYVLSISGSTAQAIQPLSFTIVESLTGALDTYRVPDGFLVSAVTLDGVPVPYLPGEADLSSEGQYSVQYRCEAASLNWHLDVTTDHTPPELKLDAVEDGYARGPVDISDLEEGASVLVELDGKAVSYEEKLTRSGDYHIVLSDVAGNTTEYRFTILIYFNVSSYIFIAVVVILLAVLAVYLRLSGKRLRVR